MLNRIPKKSSRVEVQSRFVKNGLEAVSLVSKYEVTYALREVNFPSQPLEVGGFTKAEAFAVLSNAIDLLESSGVKPVKDKPIETYPYTSKYVLVKEAGGYFRVYERFFKDKKPYALTQTPFTLMGKSMGAILGMLKRMEVETKKGRVVKQKPKDFVCWS